MLWCYVAAAVYQVYCWCLIDVVLGRDICNRTPATRAVMPFQNINIPSNYVSYCHFERTCSLVLTLGEYTFAFVLQ